MMELKGWDGKLLVECDNNFFPDSIAVLVHAWTFYLHGNFIKLGWRGTFYLASMSFAGISSSSTR